MRDEPALPICGQSLLATVRSVTRRGGGGGGTADTCSAEDCVGESVASNSSLAE